MKLDEANHPHNLVHQLLVVFVRVIYFWLLTILSIFLIAGGLIFWQAYLPTSIYLFLFKIIFLLPLFYKFNNLLLNLSYGEAPFWWAIVLGIPLLLTGLGILLISFFNLLEAIFNPFYNQAHCRLCKKQIKIQLNHHYLKT